MDIEQLRDYCLNLPGTTESFPFGPQTLVFKVLGKMYAASNLEEEQSRVNLKCDPDLAIELRERYPSVAPGYHMNKRHWNTVSLDRSVDRQTISDWIDHSYALVVKGLPKKDREKLAQT
jgi:predicted DNA-binding protein (MmcQ/YjbR family)